LHYPPRVGVFPERRLARSPVKHPVTQPATVAGAAREHVGSAMRCHVGHLGSADRVACAASLEQLPHHSGEVALLPYTEIPSMFSISLR